MVKCQSCRERGEVGEQCQECGNVIKAPADVVIIESSVTEEPAKKK
jgi:hypothetical protein